MLNYMEIIPYLTLKNRCDRDQRRPTYFELLSTEEWFNKRSEIINRDRACAVCGAVETDTMRSDDGVWHNVQMKEVYGPKLEDHAFNPFVFINPDNYKWRFHLNLISSMFITNFTF